MGNEIPWSELADAKDLYTVVEHVHSWTTKDINIQGFPPRPGNWTTQEELDNAIKVVTKYVDKHRKAHPRQQQA